MRAQLLRPRYIAGYQRLAGLADHCQGLALGVGYLCAEWQGAPIGLVQGQDHAHDVPGGEAGFDDRTPARHNLLSGIVDDDFRREIVGVQHQRIQPVRAQVRCQQVALCVGLARWRMFQRDTGNVRHVHQGACLAHIRAQYNA
ncbi:hypothetical protein D9M71_294300 [compost metagenome]